MFPQGRIAAGDLDQPVHLQLGSVLETTFVGGRVGESVQTVTLIAMDHETFRVESPVDPSTGTFVAGPLVPGRYEVQFTPTLPLLVPLFIDVPETGLSGLVLTPVLAETSPGSNGLVSVTGRVEDPRDDGVILGPVQFQRLLPPRNVVQAVYTQGRGFKATGLVPGRYRVSCPALGARFRDVYVDVAAGTAPDIVVPLLLKSGRFARVPAKGR